MKAGDRFATWKAKGGDRHRGIVALGEVTSEPFLATDENNPYWVNPEMPKGEATRVQVRYLVPPKCPLWLDEDDSRLLEDLSVARARGGTTFRISPEEWQQLLPLLGGWTTTVLEDEAAVRQTVSGKRSFGQGMQGTSEMRKVLEAHSMSLARAYYEERNWQVEDHSASESYDLLCRRNGEVRYVEVKGTSTKGAAILLTANEVRFAQQDSENCALVVVSNIASDGTTGSLKAAGGELKVIHPWSPQPEQLEGVTYRYHLPS